MTTTGAPAAPTTPAATPFRARTRYVPVLVTLGLLVAMFAVGSARYEGFASGQVVLNVFIDNAFLLVVAVGMTFVILTGGIDLSVGGVVALTTVLSAWLLEKQGWPALPVILLVLLLGTGLGLAMGAVIHYFEIQPFIVTLAGLFLARGLANTISTRSTSITDGTFRTLGLDSIPLPGGLSVTWSVVIALAAVAVAAYVLHQTRFGRTVYALGGSAASATLMGLPVARTRILVYGVSGFCSALGGLLFSLYTLSGNNLSAIGLELDAIAAVVIGGTLLVGGSGYVLGTVLGVLVLGLIQTIITFEGTLSSWWTRIFIGVLLLAFVLFQRVIAPRSS
jgi:galactofuranose transport system permease protein